ncbi:HIT-like protein [Lophiostoma macrostomum CBS 122681]|uniref:HIT-like protein n=1 Tax=Lophiostoma macrostomum CBS 122681 TaxID=1314788 RepID=A0A6A6SYV8_9PLEO|nr:HIT-like protein [Lophiostoma macrostomum CBS 122681]
MSATKKPQPKPKPASPTPPSIQHATKRTFDMRDGLGVYIEHPELNPEGLVISHDPSYVVIRDKYPKSSVHLLLLPRDPALWYQHPLDALSNNPALLADIRQRVDELKVLVASELRRLYGGESATDAPYQTALEELMSTSSDPPPPGPERDARLPAGRDWLSEVRAGVHTHPSMNHLHIHVFSRDMYSACMKHKKHYLSFNTSFLVGLDELPLGEHDARRHPGDWPNWDMRCWRCGERFGFAKLKRHLEEEWEAWKKE